MPRLAFQNALALQASASIAIDFRDRRQTMAYFGGNGVFLDVLSDALADLFFGTGDGQIGLTLMRTGIGEDGDVTGSWANSTKAASRGAVIMGVPLTAPAADKSNGSKSLGGHLLLGSYGTFSDTMAGFQAGHILNTGVPISYLEIQNEPDYAAPYDSMEYTPTEMTNFLKVLGPKIRAVAPSPLIVAPSTADWSLADGYVNAIAADVTAAPFLDIIGAHQYAGVAVPGVSPKPVWMTEFSTFDAFDASMTNALVYAASIHGGLTTGNASSWIAWWLLNQSGLTDNEGLIGSGATSEPPYDTTLTKRLYVLGNWSKFVRPGYIRIGTTGTVSNVSLTAFLQPTTGAFVVVAINNGSATQFTASLAGLVSHTVTPWITSASLDLAQQTAVPVSNGVFTLQLPASSVTSFVGAGA